MLGSIQSTQNSEEAYYLALSDSTHPITYYFKKSLRKAQKTRFNHFVLMPVELTLIPHSDREPTLDFDSDQIMGFAASTLNMLKNGSHKVYPIPLISDTLTESKQATLQDFNFAQCVKLIENEKQLPISFDVVGHGSSYGIGALDPVQQISARHFAKKMDRLFIIHDLKEKMLSASFHVKFHTCNSAYADVDKSMSRNEVLKAIFENAYIGQFYREMADRGYSKICVSGYRGYYCTVNTSHAASARIQDAFFDQSLKCDATKSEYRIENVKCQSGVSEQYLTFPVKLLPRDAVVELLNQKTSKLSM